MLVGLEGIAPQLDHQLLEGIILSTVRLKKECGFASRSNPDINLWPAQLLQLVGSIRFVHLLYLTPPNTPSGIICHLINTCRVKEGRRNRGLQLDINQSFVRRALSPLPDATPLRGGNVGVGAGGITQTKGSFCFCLSSLREK